LPSLEIYLWFVVVLERCVYLPWYGCRYVPYYCVWHCLLSSFCHAAHGCTWRYALRACGLLPYWHLLRAPGMTRGAVLREDGCWQRTRSLVFYHSIGLSYLTTDVAYIAAGRCAQVLCPAFDAPSRGTDAACLLNSLHHLCSAMQAGLVWTTL
jgi:hypothetical protein